MKPARTQAQTLAARIRLILVLFIAGLVLSGLTAFPLTKEVALLHQWLASPALRPVAPEWLVEWIDRVYEGLVWAGARYPFLAYGTDWLAFAHIVIGIGFVGAVREPVRNAWVIDAGIIASALVFPLALTMGHVREIPFGWQLVDCSFGAAGLAVLFPVRRMVRRLRRLQEMPAGGVTPQPAHRVPEPVVTVSKRLIVRETLRALFAPRRLVPILLVCVPLLVAQDRFSDDPLAVWLGLAMCLAFVVIAPVSWRVLMDEDHGVKETVLRLALFAAIGAAVVFNVGAALPDAMGMGATFMTAGVTLSVILALFLVGGWGLGRDIGFEYRLGRERARADALAREAERAQLLAIRAQLDPHFLFNTLNSIAEWCREDGVVAEGAVLHLSAMLRSVLVGVKTQAWPLGQEIELVETLFSLHRLRDPDLFEVTKDIDASVAEVPVPPLILLPLAENAAKHGPCAGHRGEIVLAVRREADDVVMTLENPGSYAGPRPGSMGLPNLERRLDLAYRGAATLHIGGNGNRTRVQLRVPFSGPQTGEVA
jgi:hypothetical protein